MLDAIKRRRSFRKFQEKDVEEKKIGEILKAAMYAPSAMHSRPWEFIVVRDVDMKAKISKATPFVGFVRDAPVILIICGKENKLMKNLWIEDCAIAAGNIYLEAQNQGLGTCFCQIMGSKSLLVAGKDSEETIRELTGAPKDLRILCIMPIGYPNEKKEEHSDDEFDKKKVHIGKY
jgi:nitroreductase